jgi:hypothetical protein
VTTNHTIYLPTFHIRVYFLYSRIIIIIIIIIIIGPMKDGLRGQHFQDNDAVIAAVRKWLASAGADLYERGIQALVHRWQKCIRNGGDYVEK